MVREDIGLVRKVVCGWRQRYTCLWSGIVIYPIWTGDAPDADLDKYWASKLIVPDTNYLEKPQ